MLLLLIGLAAAQDDATGAAGGETVDVAVPTLSHIEWEQLSLLRAKHERDYARDHLSLVDLPPAVRPAPEVNFKVVRGTGRALEARSFADLVESEAIASAMAQDEARGQRAFRGLLLGGTTLLLASPLTMIGAPQEGTGREDRRWTALFVAGTGVLTIGVAPTVNKNLRSRARYPAFYLDRDDAWRLVQSYNEDLYESLGLQEPLPPDPSVEGGPATPEGAWQGEQPASAATGSSNAAGSVP